MLSVRITQNRNDRLDTIRRNAHSIDGASVAVGYWEDQGQHDNAKISIAYLAEIHEKGLGLPKRAFVKPAITEGRENYLRIANRHLPDILIGRTPLAIMLNEVGKQAEKDVKRYMETASFTPLKPETIKRKGHAKPLVESYQMKRSITHRINR